MPKTPAPFPVGRTTSRSRRTLLPILGGALLGLLAFVLYVWGFLLLAGIPVSEFTREIFK